MQRSFWHTARLFEDVGQGRYQLFKLFVGKAELTFA